MTPARLLSVAVGLVGGGSVLCVGWLVADHSAGDWDRRMDADLRDLEERERANPSPRGDPVQNAAVGAAVVTGGCCMMSAVLYPAAVLLMVRGRRRVARDPGGRRAWSPEDPDWLFEVAFAGWAGLVAGMAFGMSLPTFGVGNLLVAAGWVVGAVAVRRQRTRPV